MDISSVGGSALSQEVQSMYAIKCALMARESNSIAGTILEDTAEISQEALDLCLAEMEA